MEKKEPTPLPKGKIFVLSIVYLGEAFAVSMIYPFLQEMVADFHISEGDIGYYAGLIAASYNITQCVSSYFWGMLADKWGRKPVLLYSLMATALCSFLFGWSNSLWFAIGTRGLFGLLNAAAGVCRTYLEEILDDSNRARGFSFNGMSWGVGIALGPLIGGLLSNPHDKVPHIFPEGTLFYHYPYLLPCLATSIVSLIGFVLGLVYLDETLHKKKDTEGNPQETTPLVKQKEDSNSTVGLDEDEEKNVQPIHVEEDKAKPTVLQLLKNKYVVVIIFSYCCITLISLFIDELYAVWAPYGPEYGGLEFDSTDIGISYAIVGVTYVLAQLFIFPYIVGRLGPFILFRICMFVMVPTNLWFPIGSFFVPYGKWAVYLFMVPIWVVGRAMSQDFCYVTIFMLINTVAPPGALGAVNGLAQAGASLFRAFAPALGGSLLSWSLNNGLPWPLDYFFAWEFNAIVALIAFSVTFLLKKEKLEGKKIEIMH
eukprot:TRINITY_DN4749_c0_g1_i1.p1 TRINITY_DN4749_c0_g1~~TRINITY_DN4749_c0_g1_i1.p1  ORF type:complete len:483 (+),score=98.83 TRINITY_DN4749_c0_g1_i1:39-1487(+)